MSMEKKILIDKKRGKTRVALIEDGRVADSMSLRAVAHNTRSPEMVKIEHERQRRKRDRSEFS